MSLPTEQEPGGTESTPEEAEWTPEPASASAATPASSSRLDRPRAREAVVKEARGYTLRLEPPDLARLRELPGARGRSDEELGEEFLAGHCDRFVSALSDDVASPATIRVVVDPWSRQAFLALEKTIRAIVSF